MNAIWKGARVVGLALLLTGLNAFGAEIAPDEVIRKTAEDVIASIKADKAIQSGDRSKAYALIDQKVLPHFDFARMTRLAVGRNWNQASADQQKQLVDEFRDLLVRTYASSLSQYKDQVVQIKGTENQSGGTEAVVHSAIVPSGGQTVPGSRRKKRGIRPIGQRAGRTDRPSLPRDRDGVGRCQGNPSAVLNLNSPRLR